MTTADCARCLNSTANPTVVIENGLCNVCRWYDEAFDADAIGRERAWFDDLVNRSPTSARVVVGISGGKDSSAALVEIRDRTANVSAFTVRSGYYPDQIEVRSAAVADQLSVRHQIVDMRPHIRPCDRESYQATAELYGRDALDTNEFRGLYQENRRHYSIKCTHAMAFVRACQLCRRAVIRTYYAHARTVGALIVAVGHNEWAGLSGSVEGGRAAAPSAVRKLQPATCDPPVFVVHLPFLLGWRLEDTEARLAAIDWSKPTGERLVEGAWNSCRLAEITEPRARALLGFSPDAPRLSREITAGFLSRAQGLVALKRTPAVGDRVYEVLRAAAIL